MKTEQLQLTGKVSDIEASDLTGDKLSIVAALCMLRLTDEREKFMQLVQQEKEKYSKLQVNYQKLFGYTPSNECLEWARTSKAYQKFYNTISNAWGLNDGLKEIQCDLEYEINDWYFIMAALNGLEMFGGNGAGDMCFLSVLPNPLNATEVYYYDHEVGRIEYCMGYSMSHFIASKWAGDEYEDNSDNEEDPKKKKVIDDNIISKKTFSDFSKKAELVIKKRPDYHNPSILFKRIHWISKHTMGSPTFELAKKMAHAPAYSVWESERKLISTEPVLANYWLLAHYFLGNETACRHTIEEAKKTPGEVSKKLAVIIEKLLDNPDTSTLGELKPSQLLELKQETRKNSPSELLEPIFT